MKTSTRKKASLQKDSLLQGARVYLSGPMDFVASRAVEKQFGWRNRVSQFLQASGVTVFDPWFKPEVRGLHEYGREDVKSGDRIRERWTYEEGLRGAGSSQLVRPPILGNTPHRSPNGGHQRLHHFLLPNQYL